MMTELFDKSINMKELKKGMSMLSGGAYRRLYNGLKINGQYFDGERLWNTRWDILQNVMDYKDKNILELGCNITLVSTFLLKYKNIKSATCVDYDPSNLQIKYAIKHVNNAFDIQTNFISADLNKVDYQKSFGLNYDIVFCLSIIKYVNNKKKFINYLSNFNTIIFEGFSNYLEDIKLFENDGFK